MAKSSKTAEKSAPVTSADIRAAIKRTFPHPEHGCVFEVAQATGHGAHRHLDAVVMDTWPSRGLMITGIEIKVDLYDWRREKRTPEKAEQIARFCDFFAIAAPAGLIPIEEIPRAWALLEYNPQSAGLREVKPGMRNQLAQPATREFLAAVFRAAGRPIDPDTLDAMLKVRQNALDELFEDRVKSEAERQRGRMSDDAKNWNKLLELLGESDGVKDILKWGFSDADHLIRVVAAIRKSGIMESWHGLGALQETLRSMLTKIDAAMKELNVPPKPDPLGQFVKKPKRGKDRML